MQDLQQAKDSLNKKQFRQVIKEVTIHLQCNPSHPQAYNLRGGAYMELEQLQDAYQDFNKAIEINPQYSRPYANRGKINCGLKRYQSGLHDLSKAIDIQPQNGVAYYNRAVIYNELQRHKQAYQDFNTALEYNPRFIEAAVGKVRTNNLMKRYEEALEDTEAVLTLNANNAQVYYQRGNAFRGLYKSKQALQEYNKAIQLDSKHVRSYINRGNIYKEKHKVRQALQDYQRAIQIDPNEAKAYSNRAAMLANLKRFKEALADYAKAIELDPLFIHAYLNRANLHKKLKHHKQEAIEDYTKVIQLNPRFYNAHFNRGNTYVMMKMYPQAESDLLQALELVPNHPLYLLSTAKLYLVQQNPQRATQYFQKCLEIFASKNQVFLRRQYHLTTQNIIFIRNSIDSFERMKKELEHLQENCNLEGKQDYIKDIAELTEMKELVSIRSSVEQESNVQYEQSSEEEGKESKQIVSDMQKLKEQIEQIKRQLNGKNSQIQKLSQRVQSVEEEQRQLSEMVKKMEEKVYVLDRVIGKIDKISNSQVKDYYNYLYNTIISHFLAYRVYSTGFFASSTRPFSKHQKFWSIIFKVQPFIQKIPIVGQLAVIPFEVISNYNKVKTDFVNQVISKKLGIPQFNTETQYNELIGAAIQRLLDNEEFKREIAEAIRKQEKQDISKMLKTESQFQAQVYSKVYATSIPNYTYVQILIVVHMILITKSLYTVENADFESAVKNGDTFYRFILKSISPENSGSLKDDNEKSSRTQSTTTS